MVPIYEISEEAKKIARERVDNAICECGHIVKEHTNVTRVYLGCSKCKCRTFRFSMTANYKKKGEK